MCIHHVFCDAPKEGRDGTQTSGTTHCYRTCTISTVKPTNTSNKAQQFTTAFLKKGNMCQT